jgi:hypothetical protein
MGNAIMMDKMLKLIVEDISVVRAEQISKQLNIDNNKAIYLLSEMEKPGHIKLMRVGTDGVCVIILKMPGRQFYKSSRSYTELYNESSEEKRPSGRSLKQMILDLFKRRNRD